MKTHLKQVIAGGLATASMAVTNVSANESPNIVIVMTDDLGYGDVACMNPESKIPTPHMERLASTGVWAKDAHAAATVCSPSRYSFLTGRYAWRGKY